MKTTIELDMSCNNEERFQNERKMMDILKIDDMKILIWDINQKLRNELKYNETLSPESYSALEGINEYLLEEMKDKELLYIFDE